MARILKKIPNFKLPKYKMRDIEEVEELNVEYTPEVLENLKKKNDKDRKGGNYPGTEYKTVKEFFDRSTRIFADRPFIVEKFNRKGGFEEITYGKFREDVVALGTGLTRAFKLKGLMNGMFRIWPCWVAPESQCLRTRNCRTTNLRIS